MPQLATSHLVGSDGRLSRALLAQRGLSASLADCETAAQVSVSDLKAKGPGDRTGAILYPYPSSGAIPAGLGYFPERQRWIAPFAQEDTLWIGVDTVEPPQPEDLARREQRRGHMVDLGGGQAWHVPVVRRPQRRKDVGLTNLPCSIHIDLAGNLQTALLPEFRDLFEAMEPYVKVFFGGEQDYDPGVAVKVALQVLAINYRFSAAEQNALGTLTTENWAKVIQAAIDLPFYEEMIEAQKKTESPSLAEPPSSPPGPLDFCPTTVPATESLPPSPPAPAPVESSTTTS